MENRQLAENIKKECGIKGITLNKMYEDLNIPKSFTSDLKSKDRTPSIKRVEEIAIYLGVSIDYLVGREKIESKSNIENSNVANTGGTNTVNIHKHENVSYLEMEILQEVKKLSKKEQIKLLDTLSNDDE